MAETHRKVSSLVLLHSIIPQTGAVALMRVPACSCVLVLPCLRAKTPTKKELAGAVLK